MGSSEENTFDGVYRRTGTDDNFAQLGGKFLYQGSITIKRITIKRFENLSYTVFIIYLQLLLGTVILQCYEIRD